MLKPLEKNECGSSTKRPVERKFYTRTGTVLASKIFN